MRYWNFDCRLLISDYEKNRRTLESIEKALKVSEGYLRNAVSEAAESEIEMYIKQLELKLEEYQMFVDMVTLGLSELPEVERLTLKYWLIDKSDDIDTMYRIGIKDFYQLNKIKSIALAKFQEIVLPN